MFHRIALLALVLIVLAACGSAPVAPSAPAPVAESAPTAAVSRSADFPLTITHARGTATLDAPAQRVVALEWTYVENLLALGVQPVGVADIAGYKNWVQIPVALAADVQDVGTRQEPNLEQIAALQPDLIIAPSFRIDANYAELNAIAPTLAFDPYPADESLTQYDEMLQTFRLIAQAVGKPAEGAEVLTAMEQTFADYAAQIAAAGQADAPFVLAQAFTGGNGAEVRLFTPNALAVQIAEQLGLRNAWADEAFQIYGFSTVSVEALPELGEAHFFYVVQDDDDVFAADAVRPLWETLPFVQAGRAHALGGDTWLFGGPLSAERLAAQLAAPLMSATPVGAAATEACAAGFRAFTHSAGESCVPENPQRIVTTQDQNALLPLLELGIRPVGSAGLPLENGAFRFRRVDAFDTSGIEFIGNYWGEANAETIARLSPDLIVGDAFGVDYYDLHSQIAPTVLIDVHGQPLDTALMEFAALVGRTEQAAAFREAYIARVAALRTALGERADTLSVSVITDGDTGQFYRADTGQALGTVMDALDLLRPAAQQGESSFDAFSLETLPDHDADVVLAINFTGDSGDPAFESFINAPIFSTLAAQRAGQVYVIDGTQTVGAGWSKMDAFLAELERILLAPELRTDVVEE